MDRNTDFLKDGPLSIIPGMNYEYMANLDLPIPGKDPRHRRLGVAGHPRGGTMFAAKLFQMNGYRVGHELMQPEGVVDYRLVTPDWNKLYTGYVFDRRTTVVRNPWKVLATSCAVNDDFVCRRMEKALGFRGLSHSMPQSRVARVMIEWYRRALKFSDGAFFQAEDPSNCKDLLPPDFKLPPNNVNSKPGPRMNRDEMAKLLSPYLVTCVDELAWKLGYE